MSLSGSFYLPWLTCLSSSFISFLHSTADPLIDLYLYISSENYSSITKSAYTAILPWYANYTIPPRRRDLARTRTAHLGLSGLDVDTANEGDTEIGGASLNREYEAAKKAAGLPSDSRANQPRILQMGRGKGLSGLLSSPLYAARFKLDALTNELLEPLSELLGKKDYLFEGDKPSSLDCLAFGYLALMFYPSAPQAWLKEAIQSRYPRIHRYIGRMRDELLGKEDVKASDVWSLVQSVENDEEAGATLRRLGMRLPWRPRKVRGISSAAVTATQEMAQSLPFLSSFSQSEVYGVSGRHFQDKEPVSQLPSSLVVSSIMGISAAFAALLAGMAIHHRQNPHGDLVFSALRPVGGWSSYGEAGDVLSVLAGRF